MPCMQRVYTIIANRIPRRIPFDVRWPDAERFSEDEGINRISSHRSPIIPHIVNAFTSASRCVTCRRRERKRETES